MYHFRNLTNVNPTVIGSNRRGSEVKTWCLALCLLLVPLTIAAQEAAGPYEYIKGDRRTVRTQMQLSLQYAQLAQTALEAAGDEQELNRALALTQKAYVLMRYAWHGVELLYNYENGEKVKTPDPLLGLSLKLIMHARLQNIEAQRAIQNSIPSPETRAQYVEQAQQILTNNSIAVARKALILLN